MIPLLLGLAAATLLSEDLACIAAGLLVARGELGLGAASLACGAGILVGDLLLFGVGRVFGRAALRRAPLRWMVGEAELAAASRWMERRGALVVLASRFLPGLRLPTYLAAGALRTRFWSFTLWFTLAVAVWTPLLVGLAAAVGERTARLWLEGGRWAVPALLALALALHGAVRIVVRAATWRGRRLLASSARRAARFEFWPPWLVYAPVVLYAIFLSLRHRGALVFTAANPGIEGGGLIGESKARTLAALAATGAPVARFRLLPADAAAEERLRLAEGFLATAHVPYPVVLKPDVGERGRGVALVRDRHELARALAARGDTILQAHVAGLEFGIFYVRPPGAATGRIFSITEKRFPTVQADGIRTVEQLVLGDPRGVLMARFHLARLADRLSSVPPAGTLLELAETGNHCRGAVFLDGRRHATAELADAIDAMARAIDFHFGRFDVRAESVAALGAGRFQVLELNGVASESTDVYDPDFGCLRAWRKLLEQWRLAYAIGAHQRDSGAGAPIGAAELMRLWRQARSSRSLEPRESRSPA